MQIKISLKPASEVGRIIGESFKPFCRQIGKISRLKEPVAQLINPAVMDHSMTGNCILIYKIMHFGQGMDLDRQDCMFCNRLLRWGRIISP